MADEPFGYKPWDVARLTPYQVQYCILRPRDKNGKLILGEHDEDGNEDADGLKAFTFGGWKEMYWTVWRSRGLSEEQIEARWVEYLKENPSLRGYA